MLENQIKFSKNSISKITASYYQNCKSKLKESLNAFFLNNKTQHKVDYLSDKENEFLQQFYLSLGKYDVSGEINNLKNYQKEIDIYLNKCQTENEKYGSLGLKLGFIAGLLICILLI